MQQIADAMGLSSRRGAAAGIIDIVNENMFGALRLVSVEQGYDPRDFALIAFGGAGPLHANALGRLTGAWPVIIPPAPGVLCAYGDATTRLRDEALRTFRISELDDIDPASILAELADADARAPCVAEGVGTRSRASPTRRPSLPRSSFEIAGRRATSTLRRRRAPGLKALRAAFDAKHERLFSFALDAENEFVNLRATVQGPRPNVPPPGLGRPPARWPTPCADAHVLGRRRAVDAGSLRARRAARRPRDRRPGGGHRDGLHHPHPPRPSANVDPVGNLLIRPDHPEERHQERLT